MVIIHTPERISVCHLNSVHLVLYIHKKYLKGVEWDDLLVWRIQVLPIQSLAHLYFNEKSLN